jgi:hypothetical protein
MSLLRLMVAIRNNTAPAVDDITNTFYLDDKAIPGGQQNYDNLAQDTANLFATYRPYPEGMNEAVCRVYDMADPKPRPPKATKVAGIAPGESMGPRDVALCLSFYAGRNLPRTRGRLYIGPWGQSHMQRRVPAATMQQLVTLATGIGNLGGVDVDWQQHSPTTGAAAKVTNFWVDNEWDTVRSRGLKASSRVLGVTNE